MFDDVTCGTNDDSWNAILFQVTSNQTHGLVADRSDRRQDRYIDLISLTSPSEVAEALDRVAAIYPAASVHLCESPLPEYCSAG